MLGGAQKAQEAGVLVVGGHTVDDQEPKYGLSVTGVIKPGLEMTNVGAVSGDVLVLTKPLGTGIITTAAKTEQVEEHILNQAIITMAELNKNSSEIMMRIGANACTDITGFGLLGHLHRMVLGSGVRARIELSKVPTIPGTWELVELGIVPGGTRRNLDSLKNIMDWHPDITEEAKLILSDAQTSGGLLISLPETKAKKFCDEAEILGSTAAVIGKIVSADNASIEVVP